MTDTASSSLEKKKRENDNNESNNQYDAPQAAPARKRKRRWGDAPPSSTTAPQNSSTNTTIMKPGAAAQSKLPLASTTTAAQNKRKAELNASIQQRLQAARLAALKRKGVPGASALEASKNSRSAAAAADVRSHPVQKKAKVYELNLEETGPSFATTTQQALQLQNRPKGHQQQQEHRQPSSVVGTAAARPKPNPYLAHLESNENEDAVMASDDVVDESIARTAKPRARKKEFAFVEPGLFTEIAERKRKKAANAEESGFVSGRKQGEHVKQTHDLASIYGGGGGTIKDGDEEETLGLRSDWDDKKMPLVMEWWDMALLPNKLKKQVQIRENEAQLKLTKAQMQNLGDGDETNNPEGKAKGTVNATDEPGEEEEKHSSSELVKLRTLCWEQAALSYGKTSALVQHIVPIKTREEGPPKQPTLYLTKKELKRQRKLRRREKQRELQDMQSAGLIPAPEPRLTLQNFMRVLGDQAVLDPSQMEQKVLEQVEARKRAHLERNAANALTKEQRAAKTARKLQEDTSQSVAVAIFYVKDMSHPYHRTKVDLNAQQNSITGGVIQCEYPERAACVIAEGGPKAIKRYTRLMTVRMKWRGFEEEEEDEELDIDEDGETKIRFNHDNKCELVWTGMVMKRVFKGFVFQSCETSDQCRKVLKSKGVGHYWDQVLAQARGEQFHFKLTTTNVDDDDDALNNNTTNDMEE